MPTLTGTPTPTQQAQIDLLMDSIAMNLGRLEPNDPLLRFGVTEPLRPEAAISVEQWIARLRGANTVFSNDLVRFGADAISESHQVNAMRIAGISVGDFRPYKMAQKLRDSFRGAFSYGEPITFDHPVQTGAIRRLFRGIVPAGSSLTERTEKVMRQSMFTVGLLESDDDRLRTSSNKELHGSVLTEAQQNLAADLTGGPYPDPHHPSLRPGIISHREALIRGGVLPQHADAILVQIYEHNDYIGIPRLQKLLSSGHTLTREEADFINRAYQNGPLNLHDVAAINNSLGTGHLPDLTSGGESFFREANSVLDRSSRLLKAAGVLGRRVLPPVMVGMVLTNGAAFASELNQQRTPNGQQLTPAAQTAMQMEGWRLFAQYELANLITFGGMSAQAAQRFLANAADSIPALRDAVNTIDLGNISVVGVSDQILAFERRYGDFPHLSNIYEDMAVLGEGAEIAMDGASQMIPADVQAAAIAGAREAYRRRHGAGLPPNAARIREFIQQIDSARGAEAMPNPNMQSIMQAAAQLCDLAPGSGALRSDGYWQGLPQLLPQLTPIDRLPEAQNRQRQNSWRSFLDMMPSLDNAQSQFLNSFGSLINQIDGGNIGSNIGSILQRLSSNEAAEGGIIPVGWFGDNASALTTYHDQLMAAAARLAPYRNDPVMGQIYRNLMLEKAVLDQINERVNILQRGAAQGLTAERDVETPPRLAVAEASMPSEGGMAPTPIRTTTPSGTPSVIQTA